MCRVIPALFGYPATAQFRASSLLLISCVASALSTVAGSQTARSKPSGCRVEIAADLTAASSIHIRRKAASVGGHSARRPSTDTTLGRHTRAVRTARAARAVGRVAWRVDGKYTSCSAGLALYLVYLLLEKAVVGWITILLELAVGVVLMGVKLYLDLHPRYAWALLKLRGCMPLAIGTLHRMPASGLCLHEPVQCHATLCSEVSVLPCPSHAAFPLFPMKTLHQQASTVDLTCRQPGFTFLSFCVQQKASASDRERRGGLRRPPQLVGAQWQRPPGRRQRRQQRSQVDLCKVGQAPGLIIVNLFVVAAVCAALLYNCNLQVDMPASACSHVRVRGSWGSSQAPIHGLAAGGSPLIDILHQ